MSESPDAQGVIIETVAELRFCYVFTVTSRFKNSIQSTWQF